MAARTKLTEEIAGDLITALKEGCPISDACQIVGVTPMTFRNWRDKAGQGREPYASFFADLKNAKAERRREALQNIRRAGKDQWQANAWYLERSHPEQWAKVGEGRKEPGPGPATDLTAAELEFLTGQLHAFRKHGRDPRKPDDPAP